MSPRARRLAVLSLVAVAALAACARGPRGDLSSSPPPARAETAETCATCHPAIAEEWRASFHRAAFTDPTFQRSLSLEEPKEHAFCLRCHAPAEQTSGREAGVDCRSCHAAPHDPARRAGARRAPSSGSAACASCHEFAFDDGRADLVQKTISEHASSPWAEVACSDCHMPATGGHKDHRFVAGHDPGRAIARAVHVTVARDTRQGPTAVRVAIRVDAGHAFPTGDMFRRARLVIFAEDATGAIIADAERVFGRTWGAEAEGPHAGRRKETSDTRIRGSYEESVALEPSRGAITRLRWSLAYKRVIAMRGPHVELASSDVVAEGELPW